MQILLLGYFNRLLEEVCTTVPGKVEALARKEKSFNELQAEVEYIISQKEPQRLADMEVQFAETEFTDAEWEQFGMAFKGDVNVLIDTAKKKVANRTLLLTKGALPIQSTGRQHRWKDGPWMT